MAGAHGGKVERAGGRVAPARAPVFGGLLDPSHGIAPRLAPSGFRRCSCCAPSPVAALEVGGVRVLVQAVEKLRVRADRCMLMQMKFERARKQAYSWLVQGERAHKHRG